MSWQTYLAACICVPVSIFYIVDWFLSLHRSVNVTGKVVLITGANSGLGKACVKVFHSAGCKVILAGRNLEELKKVQKDLPPSQDRNADSAVLQLDLSDLHSMKSKVAEAAAIFGRIDILVNNAGISYRGCIEDTTLDVDQSLMTVNYFGQVALTKAILPYMLETGGGHIVAVSTLQGRFSIPYRSAYSASKHALQAFFDCLRSEVSDRNIKVCVISPGYIQTSLSRNALTGSGSKYGVMDSTTAKGLPPEKVAKMILHAVQHNKSEIIPASLLHRFIICLRALFPNFYFKVMAIRAIKQRKDYVKLKEKSM